MDSGAADNVGNKLTCPGVPITESTGTKRGQHFVSATGGRAPNEGEQHLSAQTALGADTDMTLQITDGVKGPLFSVAKVTDRGNRVIT